MRRLASENRPVAIAQALFFVNAGIWLVIGALTLVRVGGSDANRAITVGIIVVLMLGNVGAMLLAGVGLGRRQRRFFYFAIAVLAVNIVLTVTDQFGLLDLITLILDLFLFGLLLATRKAYLAPGTG